MVRRNAKCYPIAGYRQLVGSCLVAQTAGELRTQFSAFSGNRVEVIELLDDTPGDQPGGSISSKSGLEPLVPAQQGKLHL